MSTKTVVALIAIIAIAAGGYYLMMPNKAAAPATVPEMPAVTNTQTPQAEGVAAASDTVDGFSASIDADLQATANAVGALDGDVDASVSSVQSSGSNSNLYDPNNL